MGAAERPGFDRLVAAPVRRTGWRGEREFVGAGRHRGDTAGRYLTRVGAHEVLEGNGRPNRVVGIEFPTSQR
jgi:Domain of unknown function (DUF1330)